MQFRSDSRNSRAVHDRSRGMVGERTRSHFMMEQRDKKHELESNRVLIRKALNDGFEYDDTTREGDGYSVRFINRKTSETKNFKFQFESNYTRLNSFWWRRQ